MRKTTIKGLGDIVAAPNGVMMTPDGVLGIDAINIHDEPLVPALIRDVQSNARTAPLIQQ